MPISARSHQKYKTHRKMVSEGKLVPFENAAAGHEGVQSTAAGDLIFKPCTQSEVDFYESAAAHPAFSKHIPAHVGSLTIRDQEPDATAENDSATPSIGGSVAATSIPEEAPTRLSAQVPVMSRNIMPLMAPPPAQAWTPSGGKRIASGLLIALENVAHGFKRPNILDVKLGARLWGDDAPPAKRAKLDAVANETTTGTLGFRIAGMKVWMNPDIPPEKIPELDGSISNENVIDKDGYRCYNKNYGRGFRDHDVKKGFEAYFYGLAGMSRSVSKSLAERMIADLRDIEDTLKAEESRMYSSSILMVYEGDPKALDIAMQDEQKRSIQQPDLTPEEADDEEEDDEDEDELVPKVYDVRMIDFAHATWTPGQGPDENVLHGIRSVLKILEDIAQQTT